MTGFGVITTSAYLGGHLSLGKGIGVDQTAFDEGPTDWQPVITDADLAEGTPTPVTVGAVPLLLVRRGATIHAISNRCSHRGGPLDEGELHDGCVTCPWHGSVFRLADGGVERGPAAYPQPSWRVRVRDGAIEVAAPAPD